MAGSGNRAETLGFGGVNKESRESCSLVLGVQNSSLNGGTDLAPATQQGEHVPSNEEGAGLSNIKKQATWTRLVRMDVGPVGIIREGAKSILGKRNMLAVLANGEAEGKNSKGKRGKACEDSNMNEAAGVLKHPCREQ